MRPEEFAPSSSGKLVHTLSGHLAFVPDPLPPRLDWTENMVTAGMTSAEAVAKLDQAAAKVASPFLISGISNMLLAKEAQLSARIEGTETSLAQVLLFRDESEEEPPDTARQEVINHIRALKHGLRRISELPISKRLMLELHEILLRDVRGRQRAPGQFRKQQNYIGPPGCEIEDARYVPPPPQQMMEALTELEEYVNTPSSLHTFIRAALVHYQFEAIHPFLDGNGRLGRLLIVLMLCSAQQLSTPLVYLSAYFERSREEYQGHLLRVSTHGDWHGWLGYFLRGLTEQAASSLERCTRLAELHDSYRNRLQQAGASALGLKLIDALFYRPSITVNEAAKILDVRFSTASLHIKRLESEGVVVEITGQRRNRVFLANEILGIIED